LPRLFGSILNHNLTFVIDTSGSMYSKLDFVKENLIETLISRAYGLEEFMFNIIEYSNEMTKWCDRVVTCIPETVAKAIEWIRSLESKTGSHALAALQAAFEDPTCTAVCLVTDGLTDADPREIYNMLMLSSQGRPVHVICLVEDRCEVGRHNVLENVARQTGGSFQIINLKQSTGTQEVVPVSRVDYSTLRERACCSETNRCSALEKYPYPLPFRINPGRGSAEINFYKYQPAIKVSVKGDSVDSILGAPVLTRGARVLTRRSSDGYYYLGYISQEVKGERTRQFLVEFARSKSLKGKVQNRLQETELYDLVHYEDARRLPVFVGDRVLAPLDANMEQYGPGTVLQGTDHRGSNLVNESSGSLIINFYSGQTKKVPLGEAAKI
uniref:VWFA domain-containing protein n=1 Tax=Latimeria chalumnae TaxID=7897 RepID=H3AR50_LATCH